MSAVETKNREAARERPALDVVGRDAELAAIDRFVVRAASGPAALVFEGVAGIGKTTVWACASDRMQRAEEALTRNLSAAFGAKRSLSGRSDRREGGFTVR